MKPSWKEDVFRISGKESLAETGYTDFGARFYDNLVPRFITIDRFSEKYYDFSPNQYAANNPLRFIDINGDSLAVTGNVTDISSFLRVLNNGLGGFYSTQYNGKTGLVSLVKNNLKGVMTSEQKALYKTP